MEKKKDPIDKEQFEELEGVICYIADQVAFLEIVFSSGIPPKMEENHFSGLGAILKHIHHETYKALELATDIKEA
jgi:hypothetical protein